MPWSEFHPLYQYPMPIFQGRTSVSVKDVSRTCWITNYWSEYNLNLKINTITLIPQTTFLFTLPLAFYYPRKCNSCHQHSFTNAKANHIKLGFIQMKASKKLLSNPLNSLSMVWPAQTWEWWRDRGWSILNAATPWVGLVGCGDAPGAAPLPAGDTQHMDHGQPSNLIITQGFLHSSAITHQSHHNF